MIMKRLALPSALLLSIGLASCTKPQDPRAEAFAKLPNWQGVWIQEIQKDIANISALNTDLDQSTTLEQYKLVSFAIPWNDLGLAKFNAMLAGMSSRKTEGWGFPMMMDAPAPLQFVISLDQTVITNIYHEVLMVYTDGRDHPAAEDRWPTTWGDSVGHWEGDTLVIDTVSVRDPTKYMFWAPPFSDEAHYVQRLRMTAPDRIESEFTINDPVTLTKPFVVNTAYVRTPNMDRIIFDAYVNDRSELDGGVFTILPPSD
jgi:hypothetical protein